METFVITVGVVKFKEKFLVAKRAAIKKFAPNEWEFISGFMDEPETAEQVMLRELKEETGLSGRIVRAEEPFTIEDREGRWIVIPFLIETEGGQFSMNEHDHSEMKWVTKSELQDIADLKVFFGKDRIQKLLNYGGVA
jgi:8-oxo-dGTP pyrophosphatase MutT (NUDIX family)